MRFYADAACLIDAARAQAAILDGLATPWPEPARPRRIERAREGLIEAGMLEQALADREDADRNERTSAAARLTDAWADRLAAAWDGEEHTPDAAPLAAPQLADLLARLPVAASLPEGYLFYAVYPDQYVLVGRRLARHLVGRPVVVVGVRSIGTSLSAAVAAGLRAEGCAVARSTVRPTGDPFDREVAEGQAEAGLWKRAVAQGAAFVAVDEGPGLSGSSLAATVGALERRGAGEVHIVCAMPGAMPMARSSCRAVWDRCRVWAAQDDGGRFMDEDLPSLLGHDTRLLHDLSWGGWARAHTSEGDLPPLANLERRKLLLAHDGRSVFAKFVGFGDVGRRKAGLAQALARDRYTPPVLSYGHGMLLVEWLGGARTASEDRDSALVLPVAARYYARVRANCAAGGAGRLQEVTATTDAIARDWLGVAPDLSSRLQAASRAEPRALHGDQKPEPVEWLIDGRTVVKADAADHFLDHTWARDQDICFDLAGFIQAFSLNAEQQRLFLRLYVEASGDSGARERLSLYRAVYAAHRLAGLDTAYHAAAPGGRHAIDAARQRMGGNLEQALRDSRVCA